MMTVMTVALIVRDRGLGQNMYKKQEDYKDYYAKYSNRENYTLKKLLDIRDWIEGGDIIQEFDAWRAVCEVILERLKSGEKDEEKF